MSSTSLKHFLTLLKFALSGLGLGLVVGTLVFFMEGGSAALASDESGFLGTQRQWAQIALLALVIRGMLSGLAIGVIAGLIRIAVVSRRGN